MSQALPGTYWRENVYRGGRNIPLWVGLQVSQFSDTIQYLQYGSTLQWRLFKHPDSRALQQESLPKCDQCKLPLQGIKSWTCYPLFCKWLPSNMFCKPHSTHHTIQVRFCQLWAKHFIRLALYVPSVEQVWRTEQPVTILNIAILTRSWPKLFRGWRESILHRLLLKGKGRKVQRLSHANCSHCRGGAAGKSLNV